MGFHQFMDQIKLVLDLKKNTIKKGKRIIAWKKQPIQQCSNFRSTTVKFINIPLSNFDLIDWVKKLGLEHFRGIYSRDNLPKQIKKEVGIINLDTIIG